jgi:hypothetical protein
MPDDESDDYHRGCERGVSATVKALTDVLERGKHGPFANPELDRFATVLDKMRPALGKLADPAVRACLVRTRAALAAVEEHVRGVEWALTTDADTPLGTMELLGVIVVDIERAIEKWAKGESPVREGAKPSGSSQFSETVPVAAVILAHGIALGYFELSRDIVLSGIVSPDRWNDLVQSGHESDDGPAPFVPNLHGIVWRRPGAGPAPLPLFEFFKLNREIFQRKAKELLRMLGSDTRPAP